MNSQYPLVLGSCLGQQENEEGMDTHTEELGLLLLKEQDQLQHNLNFIVFPTCSWRGEGS